MAQPNPPAGGSPAGGSPAGGSPAGGPPDEARAARRSELREWGTLICAFIAAVATASAILPLPWSVTTQLRQLNASQRSLEAATAKTNVDLRNAKSHFEFTWIEATEADTGVPPAELLAKLYPGVAVRAFASATSALNPFSADVSAGGLEDFVASVDCACPNVRARLADLPDYRFSNPQLRAGWVFLLVSQDGGGTADDVTLDVDAISAGDLSYFDLTEFAEPDAAPTGTSASVRLGTMLPGTRVALALFRSAGVQYRRGAENDFVALSISPADLPNSLRYKDRSTAAEEVLDVRAPSAEPLVLTSGIATRG